MALDLNREFGTLRDNGYLVVSTAVWDDAYSVLVRRGHVYARIRYVWGAELWRNDLGQGYATAWEAAKEATYYGPPVFFSEREIAALDILSAIEDNLTQLGTVTDDNQEEYVAEIRDQLVTLLMGLGADTWFAEEVAFPCWE